MKVKDSKIFREMQDKRDKTFKVTDGTPALAPDILREERDIKRL